jgi:hypothetical protein
MSTRFFQSQAVRLLAAVICAVSTASCGSELLRTGRSPVVVFVDAMAGASGNDSTTFATPLLSDVQTENSTINDVGRAVIRTEAKDQSGVLSGRASVTSPLNAVTITRYRVNYRRADGRNAPGVDVPFGFDGAVTATIAPGGSANVIFDLVRHSTKRDPPLRNLIAGGGLRFINVIAEVTFFGHDQNGNEVQATGAMDVIFADFADPE